MKKNSKKVLWFGVGAIALIFIGCLIWAFLIEPSRLVIHEETLALTSWPAGLGALKVAAISDIHAGSPFVDAAKLGLLVEKTNATNPDVIVLLGDFMVADAWHSDEVEPEAIAEVLKNLRAPLGVYAVLGNLDWRYGVDKVSAALESVGIKVMDNNAVQLRHNGQAFWIVGIADAWSANDDIQGTAGRVTPGEPVIALTHNPDILPRLPKSFQLTLAGHTHGGQVNIPLLGRRIVPSEFGQKYAAGYLAEDGKHLFVTTGVGTSIFPIRFRVPPEIAVLTVKSALEK